MKRLFILFLAMNLSNNLWSTIVYCPKAGNGDVDTHSSYSHCKNVIHSQQLACYACAGCTTSTPADTNKGDYITKEI